MYRRLKKCFKLRIISLLRGGIVGKPRRQITFLHRNFKVFRCQILTVTIFITVTAQGAPFKRAGTSPASLVANHLPMRHPLIRARIHLLLLFLDRR